MKKEALNDFSIEELVDKEEALRKEMFNLRFQAAVGHVENSNRFKTVRREIARILTIIRMKTIEGSAA